MKTALKFVCDRAHRHDPIPCNACHWHKPRSAEELPKHLICRGQAIKFIPVPRHCTKCDRSEAACRCRVPELIEREAKP